MAQQFEKLIDCLNFMEQLKGFGMQPTPELLAEKERLEALENVNSDEYIFGTMKMHNKFMTPEKELVVREMTEQLLSDAPNAAQPCLLLGKVQCGKTDTFLSIMGLCFDRGIDVAIVMTKGTNTLTTQTIQRLENDFRYFKEDGTINQKAIVSVFDILDIGHVGYLSAAKLNNPAHKIIIVVKKEDKNLSYLNKIFEESELLRSKKVLVCDDEADFASRNYYKRKGEVGLMKIAEHIEHFIKLPHYCRYMQITATPYSLFLQPDGTVQLRQGKDASPWLPRYTGLVPIHEMYIGGRQYYELSEDENSMYSCLFQPVDPVCIDILSARNDWYMESSVHSENLDSLNYAIVSYLFATAVRVIQVKKGENRKYKSSCLIHCEVAKSKHEWQESLITKIIDDIKHAFLDKANTDLHILDLESDAYESLKRSNELGNKYELIHEKFPDFGEVEAEVKRILETDDCLVQVVNSENPVSALLNEKGQLRLELTANIFIGGNILDRGITIDNMLCFFYGRDPKKFQMDTVLQHARMYGARSKEDMACTRFFTTHEIYDVLKTINSIDSVMYDYLRYHQDKIQTDDFLTSMVIRYDRRVNATAGNKYTPANTKVLKPYMRILPKGFQTGDEQTIGDTIKKIDETLKSCPAYAEVSDGNPFFLMDYDIAAKIIDLISSTFVYGEEWNNVGWEWDPNEMLTALEHSVFKSDGKIYCQICTNRNMSRERENINDPRGRFIDSPEGGPTNAMAKEQATDRPVLTLLRQNGSHEQGWRDTPFYWPSLMLHRDLEAGIFTINDKKKVRKTKAQIKLDTIGLYPAEEVLKLTINRDELFELLDGKKRLESRMIKSNNCSLFVETDGIGGLEKIAGLDSDKYYNLSSLNGGVFPFKVRQYKYVHLRCSMDMSGSQILYKLDEEEPYEMLNQPFTLQDVHYDAFNNAIDAENANYCSWYILYHLGEMLESKLTKEDKDRYDEYLQSLEEVKNIENEDEV